MREGVEGPSAGVPGPVPHPLAGALPAPRASFGSFLRSPLSRCAHTCCPLCLGNARCQVRLVACSSITDRLQAEEPNLHGLRWLALHLRRVCWSCTPATSAIHCVWVGWGGGRGLALIAASFVGQHAAGRPGGLITSCAAPQIANNEGPKVDPPVSKTWARMEGLVPPPTFSLPRRAVMRAPQRSPNTKFMHACLHARTTSAGRKVTLQSFFPGDDLHTPCTLPRSAAPRPSSTEPSQLYWLHAVSDPRSLPGLRSRH